MQAGRVAKRTCRATCRLGIHDPDRVIDIYIGTYTSKVRYTAGVGWQIYEMRLQKVAGEVIDKSV